MVTQTGEPVTSKRKKLTDKSIAKIHKVGTHWDAEVKGLAYRVFPSGVTGWVFDYRINGKRRRMSLGDASRVDLAAARDAARIHAGTVAKGTDALAHKQHVEAVERAVSKAETIASMGEKYLAGVKATKKRSTHAEYSRRWKAYILPVLGRKKVHDVKNDDIKALHKSLGDKPFLANRVKAVLSAFFSYAIAEKAYPGANPAHGVKGYPEEKRERYLSKAEVKKLGAALDKAALDEAHVAGVKIIRLALHTGARMGEIKSLRWDAINFELKTLTLATSKTGRSKRILSAPAIRILKSIARSDSPYVFPSDLTGDHVHGIVRLWLRVRKDAGLYVKGEKEKNFRGHDLRHSFASFAIMGGTPLYAVGKLLGHKSAKMTERYAHLSDEALGQAANKTSGVLGRLLKG